MQNSPCPSTSGSEGNPNQPPPPTRPRSRRRPWNPRQRRNILIDTLSLSDAAKLELAVLPSKTPISVLQELLCRRGSAPRYELVQIEGAIHEPTFRYRVTIGDVVASGTGRSKKEAKHAAAKNTLLKLSGKPTEESDMEDDEQDSGESNFDDKIPGNPIGTLQEMCMAKRWPPPAYELIEEFGLPHERLFTIECSVLKYKEIGIGKSKKLAKRQAANKMWETIRECESDLESADMDELPGPGPSVCYADLKTSKVPTLTSPLCNKISAFHKGMKEKSGVKLDALQDGVLSEPDVDYMEILDEIADEQGFDVQYVDIDELSASGLNQCLIQLSTFPVAVCFGYGADMKEAQFNAAQNALEYLKIMTKK